MGILGSLLGIILDVFAMLCNAYSMVVVAACLITWVNPDPYNPIVRFLRGLTEPLFHRIRRVLPFVVVNGLDLSPIVLLIAIQVIYRLARGLAIMLVTGV